MITRLEDHVRDPSSAHRLLGKLVCACEGGHHDGYGAAHGSGEGDWADATGVVMAVEVTSYDADTHRRDREEKPLGYAEAGTPHYLLIDRDDCSVTLYSDPAPGEGYRSTVRKSFGAKLSLPEPLGIELDTEELKQYVD